MINRLLFAGAVFLTLLQPAWANYKAAVDYYEQRQFALAFKEFRRLADEGDERAQTAVGYMYQFGEGVAQDYAAAAQWYHRAATKGYAEAQSRLGFLYDRGIGVRQDDATAVDWYRRAAEQGYAPAQTNLAAMYDQGRGVPRDHATALRWLRRAADQGYVPAQTHVGVMYIRGPGDLAVDYVQAYMWLTLASQKGDLEARRELAQLTEFMSFEQIRRAKSLAAKWKPDR